MRSNLEVNIYFKDRLPLPSRCSNISIFGAMEFSARQIATLLNGTIEGNADVKVNRLAKIEEGEKGSLSFLANPKYTDYIYSTSASIVLVNNSFSAENPISEGVTLIRVENAYEGFASLLDHYNTLQNDQTGIESPVSIDPSAKIGANTYIGSFCYVGRGSVVGDGTKIYPNASIGRNVKIGSGCVIYHGVRVLDECIIGNNCVIHPGAIIGGDGFGFVPNEANRYNKVAQTGNVVLEDHVEIGSNTTIDRATLGSTIIRKGVKLDNLIQIAHNVEIGENTVIAAQTGVAGSTKIGRDCMIGGQVGIIGHLTIANGVKIAAQSGIGSNIETEGEIVQGSPAFKVSDYKRSYVVFRNLPNIYNRFQDMESKQQKDS